MDDYLDKKKKLGPNVKRLMIEFSSVMAVQGEGTLFANALSLLADKDALVANMREALRKTEEAIAAVKTAPDNPYGDDDEAICAAILERVRQRRSEQRKQESRP